jgi:hypothetical protein
MSLHGWAHRVLVASWHVERESSDEAIADWKIRRWGEGVCRHGCGAPRPARTRRQLVLLPAHVCTSRQRSAGSLRLVWIAAYCMTATHYKGSWGVIHVFRWNGDFDFYTLSYAAGNLSAFCWKFSGWICMVAMPCAHQCSSTKDGVLKLVLVKPMRVRWYAGVVVQWSGCAY